ncbi:pimeloyl-ACP methyl ester carboxylesterase [Actinoplanes campanulatus]|uniref:Pimeloyl-ACP methyl ester carboxylesterase n=1 Tax=Actinoplanes campanulatus TaxID=113559 RepID=A0A7W5AIS6_9ACTN|nr:alpha/beta hydrolase [Actinoplanes campanulatus]MBB3096815.1 pimeloyl-ACP methyl ester carboxylesterase [Actinoplanes campanulatus]
MVTETMMPVNGIQVCLETFGEPTDAPLLLLAGDASPMDWWDDEFCRRLAAGGRFVIRYDHRDTGRSTSYPAGATAYSGADLLDDAVGVLDALRVPAAHLVGFSLGGALAQRIAVHHPERVLSLTLMATSAGGAGSETAPVTVGGPVTVVAGTVTAGIRTVEAAPITDETDWSNRKAAVARMIAEVRDHGGPFTPDEPQLRRLAERIFDRSADLAATRLNHRLAGYGPPVRDLLGAIETRTVVLHGTLDRFFPAEHPEELARCIPNARLVWLDGVGHEFPPRAVWDQVLHEILH